MTVSPYMFQKRERGKEKEQRKGQATKERQNNLMIEYVWISQINSRGKKMKQKNIENKLQQTLTLFQQDCYFSFR